MLGEDECGRELHFFGGSKTNGTLEAFEKNLILTENLKIIEPAPGDRSKNEDFASVFILRQLHSPHFHDALNSLQLHRRLTHYNIHTHWRLLGMKSKNGINKIYKNLRCAKISNFRAISDNKYNKAVTLESRSGNKH